MKKLTKEQREHRAKYMKDYYAANRDRLSAYQKEYHSDNRTKLTEYSKEYYQANRDEKLAYSEEYRNANREALARKQREYAKENRVKMTAYGLRRRKSDRIFGLRHSIGNLIGKAFNRNGYTKRSRTHEILGCDYPFFKSYIEQRFLPGMSWENRSEWHLDHIIPASSAKTERELLKLNHFSNFRPLWAADNIRKGDKITTQLTLLAA